MRTAEKKKLQILIVLLALIFLSAFLNFTRSPNSSPPTVERSSTARYSNQREELPSIDLLKKNPRVVDNVQRNIFQFSGEAPVQSEQLITETQHLPQETQSAPQLPDVKYLGFYLEKKPSRVKLAAISNGGSIYVGGVGDVLASRYQVLKVEDDYVVLKLLPENKILRLSLGKNALPVELKDWSDSQTPAVSDLKDQPN